MLLRQQLNFCMEETRVKKKSTNTYCVKELYEALWKAKHFAFVHPRCSSSSIKAQGGPQCTMKDRVSHPELQMVRINPWLSRLHCQTILISYKGCIVSKGLNWCSTYREWSLDISESGCWGQSVQPKAADSFKTDQSREHTHINHLEGMNKFYKYLSWCIAIINLLLIFSFHIFSLKGEKVQDFLNILPAVEIWLGKRPAMKIWDTVDILFARVFVTSRSAGGWAANPHVC